MEKIGRGREGDYPESTRRNSRAEERTATEPKTATSMKEGKGSHGRLRASFTQLRGPAIWPSSITGVQHRQHHTHDCYCPIRKVGHRSPSCQKKKEGVRSIRRSSDDARRLLNNQVWSSAKRAIYIYRYGPTCRRRKELMARTPCRLGDPWPQW